MSATVNATFDTGATLYYIIYDPDNNIWDGSSFVAVNTANWGLYALPLVENGVTGNYFATFPSTIPENLYYLVGYQQSGGSPLSADAFVFVGSMDWDGVNERSGCTEQEFEVNVSSDDSAAITTGVDDMLDGVSISTGIEADDTSGDVSISLGVEVLGDVLITTGVEVLDGVSISTGIETV